MTSRVGPLPLRGDADAFDAALDELSAHVAAGHVFIDDANRLLRVLADSRPFDLSRDQYQRLLPLCYRLSGIAGPEVEAKPRGEDRRGRERIGWHCGSLIKDCFHDKGQRTRAHIEGSVDHAMVLHPERVSDRTKYYRPLPHVPLERSEAAALLRPYLAHLEARMAQDPQAHLKPAWEALEHPLPPFEGLFWAWLEGLGEAEVFRLAFAFDGLTNRGNQRMGWAEFESQVIGAMAHPHPLVVTHAARFAGNLMCEPEERLMGSGPWSMPQVLTHLAGLPRHRRPAAGGFLNGLDSFNGGPLEELRQHPQIKASDLNVEDWVMEVLALGEEESYLPGSQAFWFYLHEDYCRDPGMVNRFLDAGERQIAWMCITELRPPAKGMEAPLARLAADPDYAGAAKDLLEQMSG